MRSTKFLLTTSVVVLALAGCKHTDSAGGGQVNPGEPGGGGGGGGGVVLVEGDLLAGEVWVDHAAAAALDEGKPLKADPASNVASIAINYADRTAQAAKPTAFSIKKNGAGGMDMTVNGETVSFAATDVSDDPDIAPFGWQKDGDVYSDLYTYSGNKDGSDQHYLQVWSYHTSKGEEGTRSFAVVGVETPASVVKSRANATYKGVARAETGPADASSERTEVRGDLTLAADFAKGSVSGAVGSLEGRESGDAGRTWSALQAVPGRIVLGDAAISSNGFTGGAISLDAAATAALGADISGSTYSGRFYGPNAEQVGGVMNIAGTDDENKKIVGVGYFQGYTPD